MRTVHIGIAGFILLAGLAAGSVANAGDVELWAGLSPGDENPPTEGGGNGFAQIHFNTDTLEMSWYIEFHDLTSPATAAHFHGPAGMNENAGVLIPLDPTSPNTGAAVLTPSGAQELMSGQWYLNVHTENYPMGEIRGQVGLGF